jgi:hypothetical protein
MWRIVCIPVAALTLAAATGTALLEKRCAGCHTGKTARGGLDMSSRESLVRGGGRGAAVVPGNAKASLLFRMASHEAEPHMPLGGAKLAAEELAELAKWIDAGAPYEGEVKSARHWSFVPAKRTDARGGDARWARNPIDLFISAELAKKSLRPVEQADPRILIRRLYLDLAGVPPTAAEVAKFVADPSPTAYEQTVERLLEDPRYGERWGRHWMDVWRYSDWYGWRKANDVRFSHMFVWRWRDWIVESLNEDKGYDRMIKEMLAADEIAPNDPKALRATGYLARQYHKYDRDGWMQDAVDHTALGFLGVTVKCARCHDHKYDPVSQDEYYKLRAFFEPYEIRIDRVPGQPDTGKDGLSRIFDAEPERPTYLYVRGDEKNPDRSRTLEPETPKAFGGRLGKIEPVALPVESYYPDHRGFVERDLLTEAKARLERAEAELRKATESGASNERILLATKAAAAARSEVPSIEARIAADKAKYSDPPDAKYEELAATARKKETEAGILKADEAIYRAMLDFNEGRANAKAGSVADQKKVTEAGKRLAEAQAALTPPGETYSPLGKVYPDRSSGRRLALANWIASRENPLTARVAVNHMWMRHFGKPLVASVFDFGRNGKQPTHPELLDWLAVEFMESGWSMKRLHRLMVTSSAYRMKSTSGEAGHPGAKDDPENQWLWRMNPRRMEAEIVRDSILAVSGRLDPQMGGPEIDETKGFDVYRRSIYFRHSPDTQMEFLRMFDAASPSECYQRNESVVPQQALALANSKLSRDRSKDLAERLSKEHNSPEAFSRAAFETILGRPPSEKELETAIKAKPESLVHVLFNHNDFITIR